MKRHLLVAGTAFALTVLSVTAANAVDMKYTYTGNVFNGGNGLLANPCTPGDAGCAIERVTVEFVHEELLPNQSNASLIATVVSWSASDGLSTATNGTSWNLGILDIQTGPDGKPIKWFINIDQSGGVGDPTQMRTRNTGTTGTTQIDLTQYRQPDDPPGVIQQGIASVSLAPGSWTVGLPGGGGGETLTCNGFNAPMNKSTPVRVRKNRVLPLRATLTNDQGQLVDDLGITAPPLVVVEFDDGLGGDSVDVSDDALPGAFGTAGNQFEFVNGKWVFNLVNENYSAPGTYTASMVSGDSSEYTIDPTCSAQFVIRGKKK